jgi:hypothetical protein
MWTERQVFAWIESQRTENRTPLKGIAKKAKAEADARRRLTQSAGNPALTSDNPKGK